MICNFCACGCGKRVIQSKNKFIHGHHARVMDFAWSRGLTKLTHPGLRKLSDKLKGRTKENHPGTRAQSEKLKGRPSNRKGKKLSEETKRKMSKTLKSLGLVPWMEGKTKETDKRLMKMSKDRSGKPRGPNKKPFSLEARHKYRIIAIRRIEKQCGQCAPNYNPEACRAIEEYGERHGYKFRHAENGGEFHIRELGYWVDGYDDDRNTVIEVDEPSHYDHNGDLSGRDKVRQKEIEEYLKCAFIRLRL